jgi:hypothetical protein
MTWPSNETELKNAIEKELRLKKEQWNEWYTVIKNNKYPGEKQVKRLLTFVEKVCRHSAPLEFFKEMSSENLEEITSIDKRLTDFLKVGGLLRKNWEDALKATEIYQHFDDPTKEQLAVSKELEDIRNMLELEEPWQQLPRLASVLKKVLEAFGCAMQELRMPLEKAIDTMEEDWQKRFAALGKSEAWRKQEANKLDAVRQELGKALHKQALRVCEVHLEELRLQWERLHNQEVDKLQQPVNKESPKKKEAEDAKTTPATEPRKPTPRKVARLKVADVCHANPVIHNEAEVDPFLEILRKHLLEQLKAGFEIHI